MTKLTAQIQINGKQVRRVPDQTGQFIAPNINGEAAIHPIPGLPEPFTPAWYEYIQARTYVKGK